MEPGAGSGLLKLGLMKTFLLLTSLSPSISTAWRTPCARSLVLTKATCEVPRVVASTGESVGLGELSDDPIVSWVVGAVDSEVLVGDRPVGGFVGLSTCVGSIPACEQACRMEVNAAAPPKVEISCKNSLREN